MSSEQQDGAAILSDGDRIIQEIDNQLGMGTLVDLSSIFLSKKDSKYAQTAKQPLLDVGKNATYNHWLSWRQKAESFTLKKWGLLKESRSFRKGNQELNSLFYSQDASLGQIKAAFSEQAHTFRMLLETNPPPWWKRIPTTIIEEIVVVGLKLVGKNL